MQERDGVLAEQREQAELFLARREAFGELACTIEPEQLLGGHVAANELDRSLHRRIHCAGRGAEASRDKRLQLVDDRLVALRREHVHERLGGENLADRRGERRRADLGPDPGELVQHVVDPVARGVRAEVDVERGDEARREAVLGGQRRDPWGSRRHRLVTDELVDEIRGAPDRIRVDSRLEPEPVERGGTRLARHAVERECERIDGTRDEVGARPNRFDRRRQRRATSALAVQPDGEPRRVANGADELRRTVWAQRA